MVVSQYLRRAAAPAAALLRRPGSADALSALACGLYLVSWCHQAIAGFGTSLPSVTALVGVLAAAWSAGSLAAHFLSPRIAAGMSFSGGSPLRNPVWLTLIAGHALLILSVVSGSDLYSAGQSVIGSLLAQSGMSLTTVQQGLITAAGVAAAWFMPLSVLFCVLSLTVGHRSTPARSHGASASHAGAMRVFESGPALRSAWLAAGMLLAVLGPGRFGDAQVMALTGAGFSVLLGTVVIVTGRRSNPVPASDTVAIAASAGWTLTGSRLIAVLCCGCLFGLLSRLTDELLINASWTVGIRWAALAAGFALATSVRRRRPAVSAILRLSAVLCVLVSVAWPLMVRAMLEIRSGVPDATVAALLQICLLATAVLPVGLTIGAWLSDDQSERAGFIPAPSVIAFAVGLWFAWWVAVPAFGVAGGIVVAVTGLAGLGLHTLFTANSKPSAIDAAAPVEISAVSQTPAATTTRFVWLRRRKVWAGTGTAACLAAGVLGAGNFQPVTSARLLFDTSVLMMHRVERRTDILPYLDEGRCVASVAGDHGELTFWIHQGSRISIRSSGLPVGSFSLDTATNPQPSAESLQAVVPLLLHQQPQRMMLIGVGAGAALEASIRFPLQGIVCVEPDRGLMRAVDEHVFAQTSGSPLHDTRVTWDSSDPVLALRSGHAPFDVIVCSTGQYGGTTAASQVTTEFLLLASRAITDDGLVCQPFDYVDCGPAAVHAAFSTWQTVFQQVGAIEIAPGRLLLTGTNSEQGLLRTGMIERLRRPHATFVLSQLGWDWGTVLQLRTFTPELLAQAFGAGVTGPVARVDNARMTCRLPWEVARWGSKYAEVVRTLGPYSTTLQIALGAEGQAKDVVNRINEISKQRDLIHHEADEYWAYRKEVKRRLKESPQSELVQVKGEEPVHELAGVDRRRLEYFECLGEVAREARPTPELLARAAAFAEPHDPLISLFLHQELAEQARKNRDDNAAFELQHRLHRAYFTSPGDYSVRNVIATIELICSRPDLIPDDARRGDQLDALLQVLHNRWHNRGDVQPVSSKIVINDIDKSVAAFDAAAAELQSLAAARGITAEQWSARELALQKSLVRPLEKYRTTLLPHHRRDTRRAAGSDAAL